MSEVDSYNKRSPICRGQNTVNEASSCNEVSLDQTSLATDEGSMSIWLRATDDHESLSTISNKGSLFEPRTILFRKDY